MKIAFTTKGTEWDSMMDPRFGRTEFVFLYNEENERISTYDNVKIAGEAHGAGPQTAQKLFELNPDVLITGNGPGGNAAAVLAKSDVKIYIGAGDMKVKEAYESYQKGQLKEF